MLMKGSDCMGKLTEIDITEAMRALNIEVNDEVSLVVRENIALISIHYDLVSGVLCPSKAECEET